MVQDDDDGLAKQAKQLKKTWVQDEKVSQVEVMWTRSKLWLQMPWAPSSVGFGGRLVVLATGFEVGSPRRAGPC